MKKYLYDKRTPWALLLLAYILVLGSFMLADPFGLFTCAIGFTCSLAALAVRMRQVNQPKQR